MERKRLVRNKPQAREAFAELVNRNARLDLGQAGAEAVVPAASEGQVIGSITPAWIERPRVGKHRGITASRRQPEE